MDAFIGEIRSFPYGYVPNGWLSCDGTILSVQQYTRLFAVIGTAFGGNGQQTFALPNLKAQAVMGSGTGLGLSPRISAEHTGEATVALTGPQLAPHLHKVAVKYATPATARTNLHNTPVANSSWLGKASAFTTKALSESAYAPGTTAPDTELSPTTLSSAGSGQAHSNLQPYLTLCFCICNDGTYPSSS